jgi:hypothetical protein
MKRKRYKVCGIAAIFFYNVTDDTKAACMGWCSCELVVDLLRWHTCMFREIGSGDELLSYTR